jgi:hypothetical protein
MYVTGTTLIITIFPSHNDAIISHFVAFQILPKSLFTHLLTYLLTYLLTPWSRVPLEKLTSFQLVTKFPAFHGTQSFITAFTSAHHLSLS